MLQHLLFLRPSIEGVSVTTENLVFKLIYAVTCPLFLAFGVIFYTRVCFADPINCVCNSTESFKVLRAIDSHCLENAYILHESSENNGFSNAESGITIEDALDESNRIYQSNYQYVGLFFVICGALCYLPYVIWEWFENGLLKSLLQDLMSNVISEEDKKSKMQKQLESLTEFWSANKPMLTTYAGANVFCEFLNFICIALIFIFGNGFLHGDFFTFGFSSGYVDNDAMFPKIANCTMSTFGPFGNPVAYGGVCVMNLNYLSEKMFYISWWWLAICGTLCLETLVYRHVLYRNSELRTWIIKDGHLHFLGAFWKPKNVQTSPLEGFVPFLKELEFGQFFMLKRIQANVTPATFDKIMLHLSIKFSDGISEQ